MSVVTKKLDRMEYLVAENISVPHCFTTRLGGVSTGILESLNIAYKEGETMENVEENIRILGRAVGFDPGKLVLTRQTHSDTVRVVTQRDHTTLCHRDYPECDALVTCDPGTAAATKTAVKKVPIRNAAKKVGPNDPCPCGSGKKYKKCCMQKDKINS